MEILDRVEIHHSIVYDFLASMYRLNNNEQFIKDINNLDIGGKYKYNEEIAEWVRKTVPKIPEDIQQKLDIFFNRETFYGLCLAFTIPLHNIKSVNDFIALIENLSYEDILKEFLDTGFGPGGNEITVSLVTRLLNDQKEALTFINSNMAIPPKHKWELLQFFINPAGMKEELISLFRWYNENVYIFEVDTVEKTVSKYEKDLDEKLKKYGLEYFNLLTQMDYNKSNINSKIVLCFSYYYEVGELSGNSSGNNIMYFMFGFKYPELFVEGKHTLLSCVQMFKALADETKLNIIKLLSKRPWYGHELAQKLGLSNSTVSYHMSSLMLNGFVQMERIDNRVYFNLKMEDVKKIICESLDKMIL